MDYFSQANHRFYTGYNGAPGTEKFTILANGNVGIGTSSPGFTLDVSGTARIFNPYNSSKLHISGYSAALGWGIEFQSANDSAYPIRFKNTAGSEVGSISTNSTATAYATSSDYRLKENVGPIEHALAKVAALKPSRFSFRSDPSHTLVDGFMAHEVQAVAPYAVTGQKNAVDADGKPLYQQVDYSKLTPLLTAAVQELKAENDTLRAIHAADMKELRAELEALKRAIPAAARH